MSQDEKLMEAKVWRDRGKKLEQKLCQKNVKASNWVFVGKWNFSPSLVFEKNVKKENFWRFLWKVEEEKKWVLGH